MFAELLNSNTEIAHMFVEQSAADFVCGSRRSGFRQFGTKHAPALRPAPAHRDFQSETHRDQDA
jgi:hypothetical protein